MSYTTDYSALGPKEAQEAALADCKEYLGEDVYDRSLGIITLEVKRWKEEGYKLEGCITSATLPLALMLGIEGYPVRAIVTSIWETL